MVKIFQLATRKLTSNYLWRQQLFTNMEPTIFYFLNNIKGKRNK